MSKTKKTTTAYHIGKKLKIALQSGAGARKLNELTAESLKSGVRFGNSRHTYAMMKVHGRRVKKRQDGKNEE